jgi:dTDP-4-dehydrorhamnose 3,5-epimerase
MMEVSKTRLPGLLSITPKIFTDERGFFFESWQRERFHGAGLPEHFFMDAHSGSEKNVLRGLHYQSLPDAQGKLVRVVRGSVFDVVVDLRRSSPTFGGWQGFNLSEENRMMLWIPEGFAHGFLTLSDRAEMLYRLSNRYNPGLAHTIAWDDPDLAIRWPLGLGELPELSDKDRQGVKFSEVVLFP